MGIFKFDNQIYRDVRRVFSTHIILSLMGFLATIVLSRSFSVSDMGLYQLIMAYTAAAGVLALPGMGIIISKGIVKGYENIFYPAVKRSVITATAGAAGLLIAGGVFYILEHSVFTLIAFVLVAGFLLVKGFSKYLVYYYGKRDFITYNRVRILLNLSVLVLVGGTAFFTKNIYYSLICMLFVSLAAGIVNFHIIKKDIKLKPKQEQTEKRLLRQGWQLSGLRAFECAANKADEIILGVMDPRLLAIYYIGNKLPGFIAGTGLCLMSVPAVHWAKLGEAENMGQIKKSIFKIIGIGLILTLSVWVVAPFIVPLVFGRYYSQAVSIARLMSLGIIPVFFGDLVLKMDVFHGKGSLVQRASYVSQIFYFIALALAAPRWGIYGVVGCVIGRTYIKRAVFPMIYFMKKR